MHGLPLRPGGGQINRNPIRISIVSFVKSAIKAGSVIARRMRHLNHFSACPDWRPHVLQINPPSRGQLSIGNQQ